MISKKNTLLVSGIVSGVLIAISIFGTYTICNNNENCVNALHFSFLHFLPIVPVFLFCVLTYRMRDEIYVAWFKFARWWIPLSVVLIFISPAYSSNILSPVEKGNVALLVSAIFFVVSVFIILWQWYALRSK